MTLRLFGRPEAIAAAVCPFSSMEGAVNTVIQTIQLGIPVARMEVIDEAQLAIVNRFSKTSYPEAPTLFFEFHGTSQGVVDDQARMVDEIAREQGALGFQWATTPEDRARSVAGAARCLLRDARVAPGREGHDHGRVRADLAAGAVHPGDAGGRTRHRPSPRRSSATPATGTST